MSDLDIFNTETAFADLSDRQLRQSYWLFKALGFAPLSHYGPKLASFSLQARLPVKSLIRATIFKQFCGGETTKQCLQRAAELGKKGVGTILDYATEGAASEWSFDRTQTETLTNISMAQKNNNIPFCVFKPTGIAPFAIMEKAAINGQFSPHEEQQLAAAKERFTKICQHAAEANVQIFVDAEETWIQPFVDEVIEDLMQKHNRKAAIIFTTAQMYRRDRLGYLQNLADKAKANGFKVGVKLVRGAYLEKESQRAATLGLESPIFSSKKETDLAYNDAVRFMLENLDTFSICLATHNEESTLLMADEMTRRQISRDDPRISFAQLLGMGDHLTFNLASAGFNAAKYVPYGKLQEVIPYLGRRAQENSSIKGQTSRELELLTREMKRRHIC